MNKYGAGFYEQELANAVKETGNEFFVAPFTASAQLASFFLNEMLNVCFGSRALLGYEVIDQAIIGIDMKNEKFKFIDRNDTKLSLSEIREKIVEEGLLYPSIPY